MSTAKQRAANKENARKSTGPVTPEGKAISSRNRVSAGFNSANTFFLDHEKEDDFWQLLEDFTRQYQPANPTEQALVEMLVHNRWLSFRAIHFQGKRLYCLPFSEPIPADLGLLIRYQATAERAFHKAHAELVKTQNERKKSEIGFVSQIADPAPPPAPETSVEAPQKLPVEPAKVSEIAPSTEITPASPEIAREFTAACEENNDNFSQAA
jgi:hypothetical protein